MGRVLDRGAAAKLCAQARAQGRRVVMTNGCFDLLHHGHLDALERAAAFGDLLVVAINDDDSVRRLKGAPRPLLPLEGRARLLAALRMVDLVVPFAEDTPRQTVLALRPQVLVKGEDYRDREIIGAPEVESWGGVVRLVPLVEGVSTSALAARLARLAPEPE